MRNSKRVGLIFLAVSVKYLDALMVSLSTAICMFVLTVWIGEKEGSGNAVDVGLGYRPKSPGPLMDDWKVMDDSSVNFHDKFFLHFLLKFSRKWRKTLSWKFTDELSITFQSSVSGPGEFGLWHKLLGHFTMGQDSRLKKQIACKGDILWHTWYLSEIRDIYHMMGMGIAWDLSKAGFLFLRQNRLFQKKLSIFTNP